MNRFIPDVPSEARRGCIAIGNFDGVHRGHAVMIRRLRELADKAQAPAVVVTFDPHPIAILRPEFSPPILTTLQERISLLHQCGADQVFVLPVTTSLLQMTPQQFFIDVVLRQFEARGIVEGPNFHFGKDRLGNVDLLKTLCDSNGLTCHIVDSLDSGDQMISSSRIRELLCSRSLKQAVELLGHPYRLTGVVRRGAGRGRTIGFPTANLGEIATLLPAHGVYSGLTTLSGRQYPVAISIGPNPTFAEHREKIECHIDGFTGDLYDKYLHIDLIAEVRSLCSFSSVDELVKQINADVVVCRSDVDGYLKQEKSNRRNG